METVQIHDISFDELRMEIRKIIRSELELAREEKDLWVAGEKDAAKALGVSVGTVCKLVQDGTLEGCYARIGQKKLNFNITAIRKQMQAI